MRRTCSLVGCCLLLLTAAMISAIPARAASCIKGNQRAATLLFPYFEIDAAATDGRTTLISIGNASVEPALAHVVIWTNCGVPVLDFSLFLRPNALQSLNLQRVIVLGEIPISGAGNGTNPFPGCTDILPRPVLDGPALESLQARLAGLPDPVDGMCYASSEDTSSLVGYVTVDVLNDCSDIIRTPLDDGYFGHGGTGLASNNNVLWGDFYLVDGAGDSAQGFEAVPVVADASLFDGQTQVSFYARGGGDDRLPLGSHYRTRFLNGGGFSGGTEVIVWNQPTELLTVMPFNPPCDFRCPSFLELLVRANSVNEPATDFGSTTLFGNRFVARLPVGGEELPVPDSFGSIDFIFEAHCPVCSPPFSFSSQAWVMPIHSGAGRFSVGLGALRVDDPCD